LQISPPTLEFRAAKPALLNAALLVDPNPQLLEVKRRFLCRCSNRIETASSPREVFRLQTSTDPEMVVLTDALGRDQLSSVAEYARRRWPKARILVIGKAAEALEDPLYDEAVAADFAPADLWNAVQRCSHWVNYVAPTKDRNRLPAGGAAQALDRLRARGQA